MTPKYESWYVRQRQFLSEADLAEVRAAQPDYLTASFVMERHDSHRCVLYLPAGDKDWEKVAEGAGSRAIEAFRAALSRIEPLTDHVEWRGCQVEVA